MEILYRYLVLSICYLLLSGCLLTSKPYFTEEDVVEIENLAGTWQHGQSERYLIEETADGYLATEMSRQNQALNRYLLTPFKLKDQIYLSFIMLESELNEKEMRENLNQGTRYNESREIDDIESILFQGITKVITINQNEIRLSPLNTDAVKKDVMNRQLSLPYIKTEDDQTNQIVLITAESDLLQKYLIENGARLFDRPVASFNRIKEN